MDEICFELDCGTTETHFHEEMEILYVLFGRAYVMVTGKSFVLGAEGFVVFNQYEHHELYRESGSHTLSAYISPAILQQAGIGSQATPTA